MGIFSRLFKSRDKPRNSYDSPSYSYFFGRSNSGKRVKETLNKSTVEEANRWLQRPCEKISVNSTTVIKNDSASGLKNSRSIFLQYTIHTVICQVSSTVSLLKWSVAEWKQTDCAGSAQSVRVHDLQLAKNSAPVSQRHRPLLCNLVGCQIQSL